MRKISIFMTFLLATIMIFQKIDAIFSTTRKMEEIDSILFLNKRFSGENLIKSTTSQIGKRILLEYLATVLVRTKQRVAVIKKNPNSWRLG